MPELPEVEAARLLAAEHLVGKTLTSVRAADDVKLFGPAAGKDFSALVGRTLTSTGRHGKNMWLSFGGKGEAAPTTSTSTPTSLSLAFHFGMTGSLAVRGVGRVQYVNSGPIDNAVWPPPFTKLELEFSDGKGGGKGGKGGGNTTVSAYADPRRFGKVRLVADPRAGLPSGRDVLTDPLSPDQLGAALAKAGSKMLKPLLMDQAFMAGAWIARGGAQQRRGRGRR